MSYGYENTFSEIVSNPFTEFWIVSLIKYFLEDHNRREDKVGQGLEESEQTINQTEGPDHLSLGGQGLVAGERTGDPKVHKREEDLDPLIG